MNKTSPKFSFKLLRWFCPDHLSEELCGDLMQRYERDIRSLGEKKAGIKLFWNTIKFFRPGIILRNSKSPGYVKSGMTNHILKIFWRSAWRNKSYTTINLAGLVIGMTAFSFITLYVWKEKSFDSFHEKKDRIYRVRHDRYTNGQLSRQWVAGPMGIGSDLKDNFSEVVRYVRVDRRLGDSYVLSNNAVVFKENRLFFATEDFFKVFSFPLISGTDSTVLKDPFTMVVSESLARRYFGEVDPVGQTLLCNGKDAYLITGVFKDVPVNTHLKFDALFSYQSLIKLLGPEETNDLMTNWGWEGTYTYVELATAESVAQLSSKLPAFIEKKMGETLRSWNEWMGFTFQPIESIHLQSNAPDEIEAGGDERSIRIMTMVAVFILGMAWINYINLALAESASRAKEVGIKKVLGSRRRQLIRQFLLESSLFTMIAFAISALLIALLAPSLQLVTGSVIDWTIIEGWSFWSLILFVFAAGISASGLYPSIVVSASQPLMILKGKFLNSAHGGNLRTILVTVQFVASMILVAGIIVIQQQVDFLRTSSTGVNLDHILVVNGPTAKDSTYFSRVSAFRSELLKFSGVKGMSISTDVPGQNIKGANGGVRLVGQDIKEGHAYKAIMTDRDFIPTYGIELIAGRNFSDRALDQWKEVVVNETAMRQLGYSDPDKLIGRKMYLWDSEPEIIGVVKDYYHVSLKKKIDPVVLVHDDEVSEFYSLKINTAKPSDIIARIESKYKQSFPGNPLTFFFLDDYYDSQYQSDRQFSKVFGLFTGIAIAIACLGLFGLCSYMVVQRAREIGIRKVLGATGVSLFALLGSQFFWLLILAGSISVPLAWWLTDDWLMGYANRVELSPINFIIPVLMVSFIAFSTVGSLLVKAIATNPTESLKYE